MYYNTADDGDHITNVDVGTQAGAAEAIGITTLH